MFYGGQLRNMEYVCEKDKLSFYHKVCALLVPTKKRIRFPCNSIPMPPARYMLKHKMRKDRYCILGLLGKLFHSVFVSLCGFLTCLSCNSELTLTLQISQWKVRSWVLGSEDSSPPCSGLGLGPRRGYALMGPSPLRASRMVLCLVPGNN